MNYGKHVGTKITPQNQPVLGKNQAKNSAGGFVFALDAWKRLDRFLILGTEGGTYYVSENKLTRNNAQEIEKCIKVDGKRVVSRIVEISELGRAPKNDPALFCLAMCAKLGDEETRKYAFEALPKVARIGTHLHHFVSYIEAFGGWGRGTKKAIANWFTEKEPDDLAYQLVKYQSRDGWSNRDLLRLSHASAKTQIHTVILNWVKRGGLENEPGEFSKEPTAEKGLRIIRAFEAAKVATNPKEWIQLIREYQLPREALPTEALTHAGVWEALLEKMPMTAMIRNLGNLSKVGIVKTNLSAGTKTVVERLNDVEKLHKSRIHPIQILSALITYQQGHGMRGKGEWPVVSAVVDALNDAFYLAFQNVEPCYQRMLLALDVSGSMESGKIAGVPGLTPRVGSAAMALITAATEKMHQFVAFTDGIKEIDISPKKRLDDVVDQVRAYPFSATDCALPMVWALKKKVEVDVFCIWTDSETWYGPIHPFQALNQYRRETGIPAKMVVVGMTSEGFSIADPSDAGSLDVVGFDSATPQMISQFAKGEL